ncbi:helicase-related protein [Streptomyces chilikensis]|uniref:helicase-related protein n=1 Tax=Streptomyces chilikensis TaxID=1194079 RepID=UPI00140B3634|nr:helicase-related protein [Streptomyces chilikensis]
MDNLFYDDPECLPRLPVPAARRRLAPRTDGGVSRSVLPTGVYVFETRTGNRTAVGFALNDGDAPVPAQLKRLRDIDDGHLLHRALLQYEAWCDALQKDVAPAFAVGDLVRLSGDVFTVAGTRLMRDGSVQYTLHGAGGRLMAFEEDLELLPPSTQDPQDWIRRPPATADRTALALTLAKLSTPLTDIVYSYQSSRTVFRPYQFRPVLKLMNSDRQRLLIADEVGLGKTIEAGLIWNELEQRTHLRRDFGRRGGTHFRGLVVCPAALVTKWQAEMRERFDRRLEVLDREGMAKLVEMFRDGDRNEPFAGVVSLERLRREGQLTELAELAPRFDLVIVDEAHYLRNASSRSHAAAALLADWADALIFLSATPLNLGNQDLYNLVRLLDESSFPDPKVFERQLEPNRHLNALAVSLARGAANVKGGPRPLLSHLKRVRSSSFGILTAQRPEFQRLQELLNTDAPMSPQRLAEARRCIGELNALAGIVNRTRKVDTPDRKALRQAEDVKVVWTPEERAFYDGLRAWCLRRASRSGTAAGFAAQMWLRQAASCIPAMQQRLRERFAPRTADDEAVEELLYESEATDDVESPVNGDASAAESSPETLAHELTEQAEDLSRLRALLRELPVDSKFERFAQMLRDARARGMRQAMVFSFFTRTLEYLQERLAPEFKVRVMHGKVDPQERIRIMKDFRAGAFDLLLVSEVGSEGLDFEFCNVLVNYDLPWNPMRVEQRIGRLDRFGQKHEKIFIFNMQVPGTIETDIFQRLYTRIGVFQDSIGELEPILRGRLKELHRIVLDPRLTQDERRRQVDRIQVARVDREKDLETLSEAHELLTGLDGLLIEGFDENSPGKGRYLGPEEIRGLVESFLTDSGQGTLCDVADENDLVDITGSKQLLKTMYAAMDSGAFAMPRDGLLARLNEGVPLRACFTASTSSRNAVPLLSVRHPLVRTAQWWYDNHPDRLFRFGRVRLPGLPPGSRYLVEVRLARADGARTRRELWTTAVDIRTRQEVPEVGTALLTSLARGELLPAEGPLPSDINRLLVDALDEVEAQAGMQQRATKQLYEAENTRIAAGRRATVQNTFEIKIATARRLAHEVNHASIRRLHAARVAQLETRREAVLAQHERDARFSLSTESVALVVVEGD